MKKIPIVIYYHGWQTSKELCTDTREENGQERHSCFFITRCDEPTENEKQPVSSVPSYTFWSSIYGNLFESSPSIEHLDAKEEYSTKR